MDSNEDVILAVIATAIALWRVKVLTRRARDGRWSFAVRDDAPGKAPYRVGPLVSKVAIGARVPIVIAVWLSTLLSAYLALAAIYRAAEYLIGGWAYWRGSYLVCRVWRASWKLFAFHQLECEDPVDPWAVVYVMGWLIATISLWRTGNLILRTRSKGTGQAIFAGSLTLVLTVLTWALEGTFTAWLYWRLEARLWLALATSLCLLFVAVVSRRALMEGTTIGPAEPLRWRSVIDWFRIRLDTARAQRSTPPTERALEHQRGEPFIRVRGRF